MITNTCDNCAWHNTTTCSGICERTDFLQALGLAPTIPVTFSPKMPPGAVLIFDEAKFAFADQRRKITECNVNAEHPFGNCNDCNIAKCKYFSD